MKRLTSRLISCITGLVSLYCIVQPVNAEAIKNNHIAGLKAASVLSLGSTSAVRPPSRNMLTRSSSPRNDQSERYIVKFNSPSTSIHLKALNTSRSAKAGSGVASLNGTQARQYKALLGSERQKFSAKLVGGLASVKTFKHFDTLLNGIEISATAEQVKTLNTLPEVAKIYPVKMRYINLDASRDIIALDAAWQAVGGQTEAGRGVKIAVVDTGIRNDNPMFADTGLTAPDVSETSYLQANPDYCRSPEGDGSFCNNKIIVARWIDPSLHELEIYANEHLSPLDFNGHGSHVAGIAAGQAVNIDFKDAQLQIAGVAPASYLMIYKALFVDEFGQAMGSDSMLLEALEYAVNDGADVINNSWGAGNGGIPDDSIFKEVFENAEQAGVIVVSAAGNDLHNVRGATISCPACIEAGIAVANTTTGRHLANEIEVNGQSYFAYQGNHRQFSSNQSFPLRALNATSPTDDSGCTPLSDTFAYYQGSIVMVDYRHTCSYEEIASNMQQGGAAAVLLYYSGVFGLGTSEPLIPLDGDFAIPVIGVSRTTGLALFETAYGAHSNLLIHPQIVAASEPEFKDMMHPYSSTGPNGNPHVLKPDMAAPGTDIISAYSPDEVSMGGPGLGLSQSSAAQTTNGDIRFAMLSGTSMASPHVAGSAALLRQAHSDWSATQIKSALVASSNPQVKLGAEQARPFDMGAGRLELADALQMTLTTDKVSFSDPACIAHCEFTNTISNMSEHSVNLSLDVQLRDPLSQGSLSHTSLTLAPHGQSGDSATFSLEIDTSRMAPGAWLAGQVNVSEGQMNMHLPIAVYANGSSDAGVLTIENNISGTDTLAPLGFTHQLRNKNIGEQFALRIPIADNAQLVADSYQAQVQKGETESLQWDDNERSLLWRGTLHKGKMDFQLSPAPVNRSLADGGIAPISCSGTCYSFSAVVNFDFSFNGEDYDALTISDNGFVIAGATDIDNFAALFNQNFPSQSPPHNIIAPLWAEYYLSHSDDPDNEAQSGGQLRAALHEKDGRTYLIVEWDQVQLYDNGYDQPSTPEKAGPFTFQLIIEQHSDHIWFNYIDVPGIPDYASIGAENKDGSIGNKLYFDGQRESLLNEDKLSGVSLQLLTEKEGVARVSYQLEATDEQDFAKPDNVTLEEGSALLIDVLNNDQALTYINTQSILQILGLSEQNTGLRASKTVKLQASGGLNPESLVIVSPASHGQASIENGKIRYIASSDYRGSDHFSYQVADDAGKFSKATLVNVDVSQVNDAPTLLAGSQQQVKAGQTVQLSVSGSDKDGDSLTYHWTQSEGVIVNYQQQGNQISFVAPTLERTTTFTFSVVAYDGKAYSNEVEVKLQVIADKQGGSMAVILLLLLTLLGLQRLRVAPKA